MSERVPAALRALLLQWDAEAAVDAYLRPLVTQVR